MHFNEIVKQILLPQLIDRGFGVTQEYMGSITFSSKNFEIFCSYDFSRSKDFYLRICYKLELQKSKCLEDFELIEILRFRKNNYQVLSEVEQMYKYAIYYNDLFKEKGDLIFDKRLFT